MEIQYRSQNGRLFIKMEGATQKEVFEKLASAQEVFEAANKCGVCQSENIRFRVRNVTKGSKVFDFYELVCTNPGCHARMEFGQSTDKETLFPKRKDAEGNWLPNGGWTKYVPKDND